MTLRGAWRPRCCASCGDPLEDWRTPLQPGTYVGCYRCARLFVVEDDDSLSPVLLLLEAPELQPLFDDLVRTWWSRQSAGDRAGSSSERRAA